MPRPIVALAVTALLAAAGCGSSAHRRGNAVLDRAESAIVEIHALYDEAHTNLVRAHEAWPESCPNTDLPNVLTLFSQQRHATGAINAAEGWYYRCLRQINGLDGILRESQNDIARYDVERLRGTIDRLRTQLEETPSEVLDPIVQQAPSDEALWNDLYLLSSPGAMTAVNVPRHRNHPGDRHRRRARTDRRARRARPGGQGRRR